ncbi:MAG: flgD [Alphaproteobacteria bacterium]|jgi:flagellar basal-body rod modification protein FlgD|nr:flgD [Alphaproteobacteria bacterium]
MATVGTSTDVQASAQKNAVASTQLNQNFDDFLQMLTTQLQNQDPLSPMDTAQFTNQLVQFSQVEQQLRGNDTLNKLLAMQTLNMTALGVSFIGKDVEVAGDTFTATGTSPVAMSYTLPEAATSGTISILDENGDTVYSEDAEKTAGTHEFVWDGMNDDGNMAPAGKYTVKVSAGNATTTSLNVTTYVPGRVTSLESADDGTLLLNVNGVKVPLTDVRKIAQPT